MDMCKCGKTRYDCINSVGLCGAAPVSNSRLIDGLCGERAYVQILDNLLVDIDKLDGDTPWQNTEPDWWIAMMDLRAKAQKHRNGYDT